VKEQISVTEIPSRFDVLTVAAFPAKLQVAVFASGEAYDRLRVSCHIGHLAPTRPESAVEADPEPST